MKISNSGKRSFLKFGRFKIGCVQESNLKIPQSKSWQCRKIWQRHYQIHQSDNQKKGTFRLLGFFLKILPSFLWKLGHESSIFKQVFSNFFGLYQVVNLMNIPTSAEEGSKQLETENQIISNILYHHLSFYYNHFVDFSGLIIIKHLLDEAETNI